MSSQSICDVPLQVSLLSHIYLSAIRFCLLSKTEILEIAKEMISHEQSNQKTCILLLEIFVLFLLHVLINPHENM